MELFVAILWYLQLVFVGNTYSMNDINQMVQANQPVINQIQANPELMNQIMINFDQKTDTKINMEQNSIDVWEEDEPEPILN